jgi:hypothetical protein
LHSDADEVAAWADFEDITGLVVPLALRDVIELRPDSAALLRHLSVNHDPPPSAEPPAGLRGGMAMVLVGAVALLLL